ncbi:DUF2497 domain-containing protein [Croceicoccus sp. BE223]|uniref:DUF2497 domain-containing protein n=1 Tax=Croceicoccus sp. BE223 TaxID=2817716 RepID=UPI002856247C|nr:DUF2497 domain-containing protein [Croceicoccus sp. BE223]MDR7102151.1 cell pole-organizing protein PopZ [Croceicoccus sp. BE223]
MQKDGEPSVEDILRSIKKVISREDDSYRGRAEDGETAADAPVQTAPDPLPNSGIGSLRAFTPRDAFGRPTFVQPLTSVSPATPPVNAEPEDVGPEDAGVEDAAVEIYDLGAEVEADEGPAIDFAPLPAGFEPPAESDADEAEGKDAEEALAHPEANFQPEPPATLAAPAAPEPAPQPAPEPTLAAAPAHEGLLAGAAAAAVREQLGALSSVTAAATRAESPPHPLEDVVRDMLRPMLKDWLDTHLQGIIERMVQDEIARITGRR